MYSIGMLGSRRKMKNELKFLKQSLFCEDVVTNFFTIQVLTPSSSAIQA